MYNKYQAQINIQFEARDDEEAAIVAKSYAEMATKYKSIGADCADVIECKQVLPPVNKKLLVIDLKHASNTQYVNYTQIGSWVLGRIISDYRFIVVTNGVMDIIDINTNDFIKIQHIINSKFK